MTRDRRGRSRPGTSRAAIRTAGVLALACASAAPAMAGPHGREASPVGTVSQGVIERSRVEIAPGGRAFKKLSIDNPLGDVRVVGYDGRAIRIETRKVAPNEDALDRLRVSLVPNPDGTVQIKTRADPSESHPVPRSAVRIDLIIHAPRDARVDAAVIAGRLDVEGMDAGGDLDAGSGPISVRNVSGEVWTSSVSGPTTLAQVFGSVDAATISADMKLDSINGEKLVASASHGRISGRRVRSRFVELTTTEGNIVFEGEASLHGRLIVSSLRGNVDVRLRRHGALVVRAHGPKVDLGGQPQAAAGGWMESTFGHAQGIAPALVELRSHFGVVRFAIIE